VLAEDEQPQEELQDRVEVLQHAHDRQGQPSGGPGEEQQRQARDGAAGGEQQGVAGAGRGEGPGPGGGQPDQVAEGDRGRDGRLGREPGQRPHVAPDAVLDQRVQAERPGEHERDPRQAADAGGEHHHRDRAEADRGPLDSPQPLAQDDDAEQHGQQRGDEVPERGVEDVAGQDGVHVGRPVDDDEGGRHGEDAEGPRVPQDGQERAEAARGGEQDQAEDQGPHDAVRDDLDGARRVEEREEQGCGAPEHEGGQAEREAPAVRGRGRRHGVTVGGRVRDGCHVERISTHGRGPLWLSPRDRPRSRSGRLP
jgi:hypothetical protein